MISTSILSIKENIDENLKQIDNTTTDYIHLDIMDGIFVDNKNEFEYPYQFNKKLDVHLMVIDVIYYIEKYKKLNPEFITFHLEAVDNVVDTIKKIKENNIKVGLSIKPNTKVEELIPYLGLIDLVLVMSVEPGYGGQEFITNSTNKIDELKKLREDNNYHYLIEVDGGINKETINYVANADIKVVGSYITNSSNYQSKIDEITK